MGQFGVGQPVRRLEDHRLLTGQGRYTDDIALPGQAYGYVLRSPIAHATIARLEVEAAKGISPERYDDLERDTVHQIKSRIGVTCRCVAMSPGEVPRSEGKAVRVKDLRPPKNAS